MTWTIEGKILDPPEPPKTARREPSAFSMIVGAVDDRGLFECTFESVSLFVWTDFIMPLGFACIVRMTTHRFPGAG